MVVLPSGLSSAKNLTILAGSAVPVKLGVSSLVWLSEKELPLSEAGLKSGIEGAAGAVVSTVMLRGAEVGDALPVASVATAVIT